MKKLFSRGREYACIFLLFSALFSCGTDAPLTEREALDFLYAYMPMADSADYSERFSEMFRQHSRAGKMAWEPGAVAFQTFRAAFAGEQ